MITSPLFKSYDSNPYRTAVFLQSTAPHRWNAKAFKTVLVLTHITNFYKPRYLTCPKSCCGGGKNAVTQIIKLRFKHIVNTRSPAFGIYQKQSHARKDILDQRDDSHVSLVAGEILWGKFTVVSQNQWPSYEQKRRQLILRIPRQDLAVIFAMVGHLHFETFDILSDSNRPPPDRAHTRRYEPLYPVKAIDKQLTGTISCYIEKSPQRLLILTSASSRCLQGRNNTLGLHHFLTLYRQDYNDCPKIPFCFPSPYD